MHKNQRRQFTAQENIFIQESVKLVGENWEIISKILPGRTPKQIHDRYQNYLRDGLKKEPWTKEEDRTLIKLYETMGPKWTKMVTKMNGRSANDIKNRWHKHIIKQNPNLINQNQSFSQNINDSKNTKDDIIFKTNINDDSNFIDLYNSFILKDECDMDEINNEPCFDHFELHLF